MKKKKETSDRINSEEKAAVIWTRVSTKEQAENNLSLGTQYNACIDYAKKHKIEIIGRHGNANESAKKEGKLFKEMIAQVARNKKISIILVYSFDRFSRAGIEGIITKQYLKSKGIKVISVTQQTDPESAVGEFMENIIFLFNQFENNLRRDKCISGMVETLKNGDWYSRPPIGFTKTSSKKQGPKKHAISVNESGELLRKAFIWKATEEISNTEILERLKREGLKLDKRRLSEIFHNPFYCGKIRHHYLDDEIVQGNQEILIDEETFNKVNGITTNINYSHQKETPDHPLKRHIICSECGNFMTGYKSKNIPYYKCNSKGCKNNKNAKTLHTAYIDLLSAYNIPIELHPILKMAIENAFKQRNQNRYTLKKDLTKNHTECNNKIKEVNIKYGLGQIPEEVYNATISNLKEKLSDIEIGLEGAEENLSNLSKDTDKIIANICNIGDLWSNGSFDKCQKIQQLIHPEGIFWNRDTMNYRTVSENKVFEVFHNISSDYKNMRDIKKDNSHELSFLVAETGLEPVTFGL